MIFDPATLPKREHCPMVLTLYPDCIIELIDSVETQKLTTCHQASLVVPAATATAAATAKTPRARLRRLLLAAKPGRLACRLGAAELNRLGGPAQPRRGR